MDRDLGKLGGKWCFAGPRLPVAALFENLNDGATIEEFLEWFPDVTAEQVHAVMAFALASLEEPAKVA